MWGSLIFAGVVGLVGLVVSQYEEDKKKPKKRRSTLEMDDSESTENFQVRSTQCRKALIKGDKYIRSGNLDAAMTLYDKAINLLGSNEEAAAFYYQRGCLQLHKKLYSRAAKDGTWVIKLKPLLPHGYQLRGFAKVNLDFLEEAIQDYEKAVNLEKTIERKHKKHVRRKGKHSNRDENKGLRVPNLWTYQYQEYRSDEDVEKSQEEESDNEENLSSSVNELNLSSTSARTERTEPKKRVSFMEQTGNIPIETIAPAPIMLVSCIASLGRRCLDVGQNEKAVEYLRRTQELAPWDYENWLVNAQITQCYLSLGDGENALSYSKKTIGNNSADPRAHYMSGEALLLLNRHKDAAEAFAKALQLNPKYGEAKRKLAHAKSLAKEEKREKRDQS